MGWLERSVESVVRSRGFELDMIGAGVAMESARQEILAAEYPDQFKALVKGEEQRPTDDFFLPWARAPFDFRGHGQMLRENAREAYRLRKAGARPGPMAGLIGQVMGSRQAKQARERHEPQGAET